MSYTGFPTYSSYGGTGLDKITTLDEVFDDFLFNDVADFDGDGINENGNYIEEGDEEEQDGSVVDAKKRTRQQIQTMSMTESQSKERR
jgi:hypothetical protein